MVLSEAAASPTSPGDTFPTDSSPTSDYDPYASAPDSSSSSTAGPDGVFPAGYEIDLSKYPKPIPLVGGLFGFPPERRRLAIVNTCTTFSKTLQRPLNKEECDAVAYHMSKGAAINSYGEPLGLAAGYWRYNNTREKFKFPFWQPDLEKLNREKFLGLRGARAKVGWELLRLFAYGGVAGFLGRSLATAYAASVVAVGQATDPRLRAVKEEVAKMSDEEVKRRSGITRRGPMQRGMQNPRPMQQQQQVEDYGGVQPEGDVGESSEQSSAFDFDDASPTAGAPAQKKGSAWDQIRRTGGAPAQRQPQQQQATQQNQQSQQQQQGQSSSDAWANRRRQDLGTGQTSGGVQQEQRTGSTMGDSYAFSGSDAERAEAKAQSQREFDERIDRERQGRNFDDSSSGRWR